MALGYPVEAARCQTSVRWSVSPRPVGYKGAWLFNPVDNRIFLKTPHTADLAHKCTFGLAFIGCEKVSAQAYVLQSLRPN